MPRTRSRLFQRNDSPFWWAVWTDHQGRVHRQSTGCRDHGSAAAWLATRELDRVKAGAGIPVAAPIALLQATAEYLTERAATWSPGWKTAVEGFVAHRVVPALGEERIVATITRADVERLRVAQIGRVLERSRRPTSNATVNRMMAALAAFGEWCMVEGRGYHTSNPWAGHEPLPEDQLPVPTLEEYQIRAILEHLEQPSDIPAHGRRRYRVPWRAVVELARETGLRRGELGRLAWSDIDPVTRTLYVVSSARRGRTKGRRMRPLPLSPRAQAILGGLPRDRVDGLVFGPLPDHRAAFRTAARAAGLERLWLHLFRHLFASRLAERGAGRAELREAGGWSSSRMADRYTHARLERLRELMGDDPGHARGTEAPEKPAGGPDDPETARRDS